MAPCRARTQALSSTTSFKLALLQPPSSATHLSALTDRVLYQHPRPHPYTLEQIFQASIRLLLPQPRTYAEPECRHILSKNLERLKPFVRSGQDQNTLILTYAYAAILADPTRGQEIRSFLSRPRFFSRHSPSFPLSLGLESTFTLGCLLRGDLRAALEGISRASLRLSQLPSYARLVKASVLGICSAEVVCILFFIGSSVFSDDPGGFISSDNLVSLLLNPGYPRSYLLIILILTLAMGFGFRSLYFMPNLPFISWTSIPPWSRAAPAIRLVPLQDQSLSSHRDQPRSTVDGRWGVETWLLERAGLDAARFWRAAPDLRRSILDLEVGKGTKAQRSLTLASLLQHDRSGQRRYFMLSVLLGLCRYGDVQGVQEVLEALRQANIPLDLCTQSSVESFLSQETEP
ncbi:MAG: hypothetical protein DHS80DRAFT_26194 [Piptocephalis tieghemiana]|nr:MAG: hypothetical protein DHS80DRAFT_26194 [Piptocephalis tieghemiana]